MTLNQDELDRLALGGTTRLPAVQGTIRFRDAPGTSPTGDEVVAVTERKNATDANVWLVQLKRIAGIEIPQKDAQGNPIDPKWEIGMQKIFTALTNSAVTGGVKGFAYVGEEEPVLFRLEYGTTAGDSRQRADQAKMAGGFNLTCHPKDPPPPGCR